MNAFATRPVLDSAVPTRTIVRAPSLDDPTPSRWAWNRRRSQPPAADVRATPK
jgi:hypothetical protein